MQSNTTTIPQSALSMGSGSLLGRAQIMVSMWRRPVLDLRCWCLITCHIAKPGIFPPPDFGTWTYYITEFVMFYSFFPCSTIKWYPTSPKPPWCWVLSFWWDPWLLFVLTISRPGWGLDVPLVITLIWSSLWALPMSFNSPQMCGVYLRPSFGVNGVLINTY